MNSRVEHNRPATAADILKYAVAVALAVAGLVAFYWFQGQWPAPARIVAVIVGVLAAVGVFMLTPKGVATREFLSEARFELRKVVWPTRQEAVRMTWVVMIVVAIIALILMGFDAVIRVGIKFLLGQ